METDEAAVEAPKPNRQIAHQGIAVLGIALIAMGEDIGAEMCNRTFSQLVSHLSSPGATSLAIYHFHTVESSGSTQS